MTSKTSAFEVRFLPVFGRSRARVFVAGAAHPADDLLRREVLLEEIFNIILHAKVVLDDERRCLAREANWRQDAQEIGGYPGNAGLLVSI